MNSDANSKGETPVDNKNNPISKVSTPKERDDYPTTEKNEPPQGKKPKTNIDRPRVNNRYPNILVRDFSQESSLKKSSNACASRDVCVEYISEFDIYNQVFNSSFQDEKSAVMRRLRALIVDWTAEEIYKRNLASDITDEVHILRVIDVSRQYDDRPAVRYYASIVVRRTQISIIRQILASVFEKLQKESFATSNQQANWSDLLVIPI